MKSVWIMLSIYRCVWKYNYKKKFKCYVMSNDAYDLIEMSLEEIKLKLSIRGVDKIWKSKNESTFLPKYNIDLEDFERYMEAEDI